MVKNNKLLDRVSKLKRETSETKIDVKINLDGKGNSNIKTKLPFFDHMLEQLSKHSLIDIDLICFGDIHIDAHHTIEDVGWALGKAVNDALGDKKGIKRYSYSFLPMDECLTRCCIDISGRPWLIWNVFLPSIKIKDIETEIFREFFQSFTNSSGITIHIENLYGNNSHHIVESCFKSLAIAIKEGIKIDPHNSENIPSTKGSLAGSY